MLEGLEVSYRQLFARLLWNAQYMSWPVEPIQGHLVDGFSILNEVEHGIEMRALMGAHADLVNVILECRYGSVRNDAKFGIGREGLLTVDQRMSQVDEPHN